MDSKTTYRPALVVVSGILGFLLAVSFNTNSRAFDVAPDRESDLVGVVRDMEEQRLTLEERLAELRDHMTELEREAADDSGVSDTFSRELEQARALAGLTELEGPGVEITLGDGTEVGPGEDPNDYLIHDTDIAAVVNALLASGAEAVEINGERVVATTPIRCAGTTVLVNAARLGSPYLIKAIGDSGRLEEAVMNDPAASLLFTTYQQQYGLRVSMRVVPEVQVAAYRGSLRPMYAAPADGRAGS